MNRADLVAVGYGADGEETASDKVETTLGPAAVQLIPSDTKIAADGAAVSVVTVRVNDAQGRMVPTAGNLVSFELSGPGRIIGVGNGDPASQEADKYVESVHSIPVMDCARAVSRRERGSPTIRLGRRREIRVGMRTGSIHRPVSFVEHFIYPLVLKDHR